MRLFAILASLLSAVPALALPPPCDEGVVWEDRNGNGVIDPDEKPLSGIKVSDGVQLVLTDEAGRYRLPWVHDRTVFVIKPAAYDLPLRSDGLPDFWIHRWSGRGPALKYGGLQAASPTCRNFGLLPRPAMAASPASLEVLVFSDIQVSSRVDVDYYRRDIVEPLVGRHAARFGITLGDVVNDDLSLYPELNKVTGQLQIPWLHVAGNHDLDFDAGSDVDSLLSFRNTFGPDTMAWEEGPLVFIGLDDVVYLPGQKPAYIGGLREDQFTFLEAYLPSVQKDRLLVLGMHIPLFDAEPGRETFRRADRKRLFALLQDFPHVLLLSGHEHTQRHVYHAAASDWRGAVPLHEYSVGAACGAYWSGVKDATGIPDSTMADGTPNGYATLRVGEAGNYALAWHPARDPQRGMALHAPRVLRKGTYPAWGIYANVFMGQDDTRVEYRVDGGEWKAMKRVLQADPGLLAENARDDQAQALRGYDRSPEATPSSHLWRGPLPTDLEIGEHVVDVQAWDPKGLPQRSTVSYRLQSAEP